jgi:hypothetical protein
MSLKIPMLPANLRYPVRSLTRAAYLFRGVLVQSMQGVPLDDILEDREEALLLADRVLDQWADYFGVGTDAEENLGNGTSP